MTDEQWDVICFVGGAVVFVGGIAWTAIVWRSVYALIGLAAIMVGVALLTYGVLRHWWKKKT